MNQGPRSTAHSMLNMVLQAAQKEQGPRPMALASGGAVTTEPYLRPLTLAEFVRQSMADGADGPEGSPGSNAPGAGGTVGSVGLGLMGYGELGLAPGSMVAGLVGPAMADMAIDQEAATDQAIANAIASQAISSVDVGPMGTEASVGAPGSAVSGAADESSHSADGNNPGDPGSDGPSGPSGPSGDSTDAGDSDDSSYRRGGLVRKMAEGGKVYKSSVEMNQDELVTDDINNFIRHKIYQYQNGLISLDDLARYLPGVDPYDVANMFGGTDSTYKKQAMPNVQKAPFVDRPPETPMVESLDELAEGPKMDNAPLDTMPGTGRLPSPRPDEYYQPRQDSTNKSSTLKLAKGGEATDQGPRDTQQFVERQMVTMGLPKEAFDPMFSAAVPDYAIDLRPGTDNAGVAPYKDPALVRDADPALLKRSPATLSHEFEHQLAGKAALRYAGLPPELNASQAAKNYLAMRKMEREDPARAAELNAMMDASPPVYFMQENMQKRGLSEADAKQVFKELKSEFGRPELAKYLMEKFPAQKELGRIGRPGQPLHEYLADLSGLETRFRTDLTQDPYIRRYVFGNDDKLIADYKAVTGLRQERLDAKDLPPYTPDYKAGNKGVMDWIKKRLGYAEGGEVSPPVKKLKDGGDPSLMEAEFPNPEDPYYGQAPSESRSMLGDLIRQGAFNIKQAFTDPRAFHTRAAQNLQASFEKDPVEFAMNFTGGGLGGVIKPKGGTWLPGTSEEAVKGLVPKRFVSIDAASPGVLRNLSGDLVLRNTQYQEILQKGLRDLEAGADPGTVYKQTLTNNPVLAGQFDNPDIPPLFRRDAVSMALKNELRAIEPRVALDNWINKTLGRYISRDMATPEDPIRKMIDQNIAVAEERRAIGQRQISKLEADIAKAKAEGRGTRASEDRLEDLKEGVEDAYSRAMASPLPGGNVTGFENRPTFAVSRRRIEEGFPEEGLAKSTAAKRYEEWADYAIKPRTVGNIIEDRMGGGFTPEQLDAIIKSNEMVYTAPYLDLNAEPPFQHLIDELKNALTTGRGDLPDQLKLTVEQLNQMGVEKAFRHVQRIDDWRYAQKTQADLERAGRSTELVKAYEGSPKDLRWVQIKKIGEGTEAEKALQDALGYEGQLMGHCVGGYCPPVLSGETQIFSLRDRRGMPHVTIEVRSPDVREHTPLDFIQENPSLANRYGITVDEFDALNNTAGPEWRSVNQKILASPEYQKWLAAKPPAIEQVKGKGNLKPKEDYIPYVQDFIKSREWSMVGDLNYTDMTSLSPQMLSSLKKRGINPDVLYTSPNGLAYISKSEFERLAKEMSPAERNSVSSNASFSRQLRGEE